MQPRPATEREREAATYWARRLGEVAFLASKAGA